MEVEAGSWGGGGVLGAGQVGSETWSDEGLWREGEVDIYRRSLYYLYDWARICTIVLTSNCGV